MVYSVNEYINKMAEKDNVPSTEAFELENQYALEVRLNNNMVWSKAGAMVARTGNVKFTRQGILEQGLGTLLKKAISAEGLVLMKMEGNGRVYLADQGKKITLLRLQNETIFVNGNDVLALEQSIDYKITMMRKIASMLSGGLFNMKLSGSGVVAITSHFDPIAFPVNQQTGPVFTDPNATIAWSGNLAPEITTDISFSTFIGRTSGETVQMKFTGEGWVLVQPFEEVSFKD